MKSHMGFRLVRKSMTSNDLELRDGHYFALFRRIWALCGQLRKSGWLAINRFFPRNVIKYTN